MPEVRIGNEGDKLFVQVVQCGTWENSLGLLDHCQRALDGGARVLIVDLSACDYLDSTFCGMLVDLSQRLAKKRDSVMKIFGISDRVYKTMAELGLLQFFPVVTKDAPPMTIKTTTLPAGGGEKIDRARHVIRAHENLIGVNPENEVKFSDALKMMRDELDREE